AAAAPYRRARGADADRPGQGRRRFPPGQRRAVGDRDRRAGAVHAAGVRDAAEGPAPRPVGDGGGGDRPLEHCRQADGRVAAEGKRHRHHRPQPHARCRGACAQRRYRRRGGRHPGVRQGRLGEAGGDGDRRRHQPDRGRAGRRRRPRGRRGGGRADPGAGRGGADDDRGAD
ncbi:hypothetical protein LTR94_031673, partial [Friedmanniomyces endolithicus]